MAQSNPRIAPSLTARDWSAIVVAVDGSADSRLAATAAAELAQRTGARLHVAHAWLPPVVPFDVPGGLPNDWMESLRTEAADTLEREVQRLQKAGFGVAKTHLVQGRSADSIMDIAHEVDADLVVCGSRGLGAFRRLLMGSVSETLVSASTQPVLVIPGLKRAWPPSHVVVGYDGSQEATRAAEWGASLAQVLGLQVQLKEALWTTPAGYHLHGHQDRLRELMARSAAHIEAEAERLQSTYGVSCHAGQVVDEAVAALLVEQGSKTGDSNALLVVGRRGLGMAQRIALGSVSSKVIRGAQGPVLVCPNPGAAARTTTGNST